MSDGPGNEIGFGACDDFSFTFMGGLGGYSKEHAKEKMNIARGVRIVSMGNLRLHRFISLFLFAPLVGLMALASSASYACSTLGIKDISGRNFFYGRNYDRDMRDTLVFVNPRGQHKRAMTTSGNPVNWTATYGSITFNQYGRDFPLGGMNEKGLVIEVMLCCSDNKNGSTYSAGANSPSVNGAQWVQLQLDTASTVEEVIKNAKAYSRVDDWGAPLHFQVCDAKDIASPHCATLEFLDNNLVIDGGGKLGVTYDNRFIPVRMLTNTSYKKSLELLKGYEGFGGNKALPSDPFYNKRYSGSAQSTERFIRGAAAARKLEDDSSDRRLDSNQVFNVMNQITYIGDDTKFQVVYDFAAKSIRFRDVIEAGPNVPGGVNARTIKTVTLNDLDLEVAQVMDMQDADLTRLVPAPPSTMFVQYEPKYNRALVVEANNREIHMEKHVVAGKMIPKDIYKKRDDKWWADHVVLPLWYGYPELYTAPPSEEIDTTKAVNLILTNTNEVISEAVNDRLPDPYPGGVSGKKKIATYNLLVCKADLYAKYSVHNIRGLKGFHVDSIVLDSFPKHSYRFTGTLWSGRNYSRELTTDVSGSAEGHCGRLSVPTPSFSGTTHTTYAHVDAKGAYDYDQTAGCINLGDLSSLELSSFGTTVDIKNWGVLNDFLSALTSEITLILGNYIGNTIANEVKGDVSSVLKNNTFCQ